MLTFRCRDSGRKCFGQPTENMGLAVIPSFARTGNELEHYEADIYFMDEHDLVALRKRH
ncbi:MAG: hypothetical protein ACP5DZ_07750 [Bacteroidales bacterium]